MSGHDDDDDTPQAEIIAWPKATNPTPPEAGEDTPEDEAEALVLKALSSITGRDPQDLLEEIRRREGEPADPRVTEPSNVVDLAAIRQARQREQDPSAVDLGDVVRAGFRAVMDALIARRPTEGELVIDSTFVREHGPEVLGTVLQTVGKAFLERAGAKEAPESPAADMAEVEGEESDAEAQPAEAAGTVEAPPQGPVAIRVDLGSLAGSLLSRLGLFRGSVGQADPSPADDPQPEGEPEDD